MQHVAQRLVLSPYWAEPSTMEFLAPVVTRNFDVVPATVTLYLQDVTSPLGAVIQQAVFVNNGTLEIAPYGTLNIVASPDAYILNNGTFDVGSASQVNVAIYGNGTIEFDRTSREAFQSMRFTKPVGEGQAITVGTVPITLTDPFDFRATINDFGQASFGDGTLAFSQQVTSALFSDHTLTLKGGGGDVIAQLHFSADTTADDIGIQSSASGTLIFKTHPSPGYIRQSTI